MNEKDERLNSAIKAFSEGSISVGRAAEIAEVPIQEFLVELTKRDIKAYPYTDRGARQEIKL